MPLHLGANAMPPVPPVMPAAARDPAQQALATALGQDGMAHAMALARQAVAAFEAKLKSGAPFEAPRAPAPPQQPPPMYAMGAPPASGPSGGSNADAAMRMEGFSDRFSDRYDGPRRGSERRRRSYSRSHSRGRSRSRSFSRSPPRRGGGWDRGGDERGGYGGDRGWDRGGDRGGDRDYRGSDRGSDRRGDRATSGRGPPSPPRGASHDDAPPPVPAAAIGAPPDSALAYAAAPASAPRQKLEDVDIIITEDDWLRFKERVVEVAKPVLRVPYERGELTRDAFKQILRKVADKVIAGYKTEGVDPPHRLDDIEEKQVVKITKLANDYVGLLKRG